MKAYCDMSYLSRERWISFWYQIMEVSEFSPKSVLEIGVGSGIVNETLKKMGMDVETVDVDNNLKTNVKGDVRKLPFKNKSFEVVLVAEVLEHIPFFDFINALSEIARVAKNGIVITLPHFHQFAPAYSLKIFPYVPRVFKVFPITFPVEHKFDGQHYWEIGKKNYPVGKIREILNNIKGFKLEKDYLIEENPYHHVFVLKSDANDTNKSTCE